MEHLNFQMGKDIKDSFKIINFMEMVKFFGLMEDIIRVCILI